MLRKDRDIDPDADEEDAMTRYAIMLSLRLTQNPLPPSYSRLQM